MSAVDDFVFAVVAVVDDVVDVGLVEAGIDSTIDDSSTTGVGEAGEVVAGMSDGNVGTTTSQTGAR